MDTKKILIAVGGVVVVLAAFFLNFWFTRPIYRFNKAIEGGDYVKAAELLDQVGQDNYDGAVQKIVLKLAEISDEYVSEKTSYEDAMERISVFDNTSFAYNETYALVKEGISKQKKSKEAWRDGKSAYENKDYISAVEELKNVILTDSNYNEAQVYIEECNDEIMKSFTGTWYCDIDLGKGELRTANLDQYGEDVPLPMTLKMDFTDNGKMLMSLESDTFAEDFERYLENLISVSLKALAAKNGISEKEASHGIEVALGKSLHDYIYDIFNCEKFIDAVENSVTEYNFNFEAGQLILENGGDITKCSFENGDILLDDLPSRTKHKLQKLNVEVPLRFVREDRQSSIEQDAEGSEESGQ